MPIVTYLLSVPVYISTCFSASSMAQYILYRVASHFGYCQAQPQNQLSWAELALILKYPASARPGLVPDKLPKKPKFDMLASFNQTRTNIKKK